MFVQVIQGQVSDPSRIHAALDQWARDLAPGAEGWLGSTAGVTDDGMFVEVVRFDTEESARRNSSRPEQDQWWAQTSKLFAGKPEFRDSTDVIIDTPGDPNRAGFVQIMEGRGTDPDRARELMEQDSDKWAEFRPDILGSVGAQHPGGAYTMAMYFTSEREAREGERKEPPPELQAQMDEMNTLSVGTPEFYDIKDPWMYSPR
jgi:hypothetical protein